MFCSIKDNVMIKAQMITVDSRTEGHRTERRVHTKRTTHFDTGLQEPTL